MSFSGTTTLPTGVRDTAGNGLAIGDGSTMYESGFILTLSATDNLSIDANIQMGVIWPEHANDTKALDLGFDLAIGYTFNTFQLVIEFNQTHTFWQNHLASLISTHVGFTWEINQRVIIVTGPRFDLAGKNQNQAITYNLAFTILL